MENEPILVIVDNEKMYLRKGQKLKEINPKVVSFWGGLLGRRILKCDIKQAKLFWDVEVPCPSTTPSLTRKRQIR